MSRQSLIIKRGAAGDVVRTTALVRRLRGDITWLTDYPELLAGVSRRVRALSWQRRRCALDRSYELVVNLEDAPDTAEFVRHVAHETLFGAYFATDRVRYTESARSWFDLGLVSAHGRERANALKLANRRSYQELVFTGLGWEFRGERYLIPETSGSHLRGDVALATAVGRRWPAKGWPGYAALKQILTSHGLVVNELPRRATLHEHIADVRNHRCLVSGDSLPMHIALGTATPCVTLFTCTSPWEIHDYGVQTKIVSPRLAEFFYTRHSMPEASGAIGVEEVAWTALRCLESAAA